MPAPPSTKQKAANQTAMNKAKASSNSYGGINTSTVRTQDRGSTNSYGANAAQRQAAERSQYRSPPATGLLGSNGNGVSNMSRMITQYNQYRSPQNILGSPAGGLMDEVQRRTAGMSGGILGAPSPLMQKAMDRNKANLLGQQYSQYRSPPGEQTPPTIAPGSPDAQYLQNQYRAFQNPNMFVNQTEPAQIPIPRQNPLSNTDLFGYQKGRPRDYIFRGMEPEAISRLVSTQQNFGEPVTLTSGARGATLNKAVGGVFGSQHLGGNAIDMAIDDQTGEDTARLIESAKQAGFTGIGGYRPGKVHADTGPERAWGPSTKRASISRLPASMQQALLSPAPQGRPYNGPNVITAAADNIPIPQRKPGIPSTVAPATGAPIPQMKPRIPSDVAPPNGVPIPREKPQVQMASSGAFISPAGGELGGINLSQDQLRQNAEAFDRGMQEWSAGRTGNPAPQTGETGPSFWQSMTDAGKAAYSAVDENLIQPTKEQIAKYGGFERAGKLAQAAVGIMNFLPGGKVDNSRYTDRTTEGVKSNPNSNGQPAPAPLPPAAPLPPPPVNPMQPWLYPQYSQSWAGLPQGVGGYARG